MSKQIEMLVNCYNCFKSETASPREVFVDLLDFAAMPYDFETPVASKWIKQDTLDVLHETYNLDILREASMDWFGMLHDYLDLNLFPANDATDEDISSLVASSINQLDNNKNTNTHLPSTALDTEALTGKKMIELWKRDPSIIIYAVEKDLLMYKIALLNAKIYNINASILYAPFDCDISPQSPNWRESNEWYPTSSRISVKERTDREQIQNGFYRFK